MFLFFDVSCNDCLFDEYNILFELFSSKQVDICLLFECYCCYGDGIEMRRLGLFVSVFLHQIWSIFCLKCNRTVYMLRGIQ